MRSNHEFGAWVKQQRKALELTQAELALKVGCTLSMLQKVEVGLRQPSRQLVERLAQFLDIAEDDFAEFMRLRRINAAPPASPLSVSAPLRPLSQALTTIFGRDPEAAHLLALLRPRPLGMSVRLLSLTGPGGVGKTRLALHLLDLLAEEFADGVVELDLTALRDPQLVIPTLIHTLGLPESGRGTAVATLTAALQDKHMLILLDNFEHVLPAAPEIATLLTSCLRLTILVTSREPLHVYGEQQYQVPPLVVPDPTTACDVAATSPAVGLFVARTQAAQPDFVLTEENTAAVIEICQRLDGLPLAIELAAARAHVLPPAVLLERLDHPLDVLPQQTVNVRRRHQTLRQTIAWSYELLTPGEQQIFRQSAIFVGGMTLEALETVIQLSSPDSQIPDDLDAAASSAALGDSLLSDNVLEGIEALIDKSLLRCETGPDNQMRFRMLETIREYALEGLQASGEQPALADEHAAYFLELAETAEPLLRGTEQRTWLTLLATERPNLRAALTWTLAHDPEQALRLSGALGRFWYTHGHYTEGRQWLEATLAHAPAVPAALRAKALNGLGLATTWQSDYAAGTRAFEAALSLWRELGDTAGIAQTLGNLGNIASFRGDYARSVALYQECLAVYRELDNRWGVAHTLNNLGLALFNQGQVEQATACYDEALPELKILNDTLGQAITYAHLGRVALYQGDYTRATVVLSQGLRLAEELDTEWIQAVVFDYQARVRLALGDLPTARRLLMDCIRIRQRLGMQQALALALDVLAELLIAEGHHAAAPMVLGAVAALRQALGTAPSSVELAQITATTTSALAHMSQADFDAAYQAGAAMPLKALLDQMSGTPSPGAPSPSAT